MLVPAQTADGFAQALRDFDGRQFSPEVCRETAAQFDEAVFTHQFKAFVEQKWDRVRARTSHELMKSRHRYA